MEKISVGYFADGPWSHQALKKFISDPSIQICFICARYNNPDPILKTLAETYHIDFIVHPNINSNEFFEQIKPYNCHLFISMSFNQIFKNKLIYYPKLRAINCHAGKLPYYRGRNVLNWALINDEKEFGITVHYIDEGIDTGDILSQQMYPITDKDNYATLLEVAHRECASLLYQTIKQLQTGTIIQIKQSSIAPDGFYCTARKVGDERLNWHQNSRDIFNFIRGLCCPGPEARTFYGEQEIKINCAEFLPHLKPHKGIPGAIVGIDSNSFYVKTLDTYIKVTDWSGINKLKIGARLS